MVKSIGSIGCVFVMMPVIGVCKKSSFGRTFLFPLIKTALMIRGLRFVIGSLTNPLAPITNH